MNREGVNRSVVCSIQPLFRVPWDFWSTHLLKVRFLGTYPHCLLILRGHHVPYIVPSQLSNTICIKKDKNAVKGDIQAVLMHIFIGQENGN